MIMMCRSACIQPSLGPSYELVCAFKRNSRFSLLSIAEESNARVFILEHCRYTNHIAQHAGDDSNSAYIEMLPLQEDEFQNA